MVGECAWLEVVAVNEVGAFLDWGLPKQLLLPFAEQKFQPVVGRRALVYIYMDNTQPLFASMRIDKVIQGQIADTDR